MAEPAKTRQIQDVVAPPIAKVDTTPPVADATKEASISMHQNGMATREMSTAGSQPATADNVSDAAKQVSNTANTIAPPSTELDATKVSEEPDPTAVANDESVAPETTIETPETVTKDTKEEPEEPEQTRVTPSPYEAHDSLPDAIDIQKTELTNGMQAPRIYDTTEYVVPIKDTMHSHGHLVGTIIAGIVSAAVVLAVIAAVALYVV